MLCLGPLGPKQSPSQGLGQGQGPPLHSPGCLSPAQTVCMSPPPPLPLSVTDFLRGPASSGPGRCSSTPQGSPARPSPPRLGDLSGRGGLYRGAPPRPPARTEGGAPSLPCSLSVPQHSRLPQFRVSRGRPLPAYASCCSNSQQTLGARAASRGPVEPYIQQVFRAVFEDGNDDKKGKIAKTFLLFLSVTAG